MLWGSHLWSFGPAAVLLVLRCATLGLEQSYRMACVTMAIVMHIHTGGAPWSVAFCRFLEVGLGIVIALLISALPQRPPREA